MFIASEMNSGVYIMQNDMAVEGNSNCKRKNNVQGNFLISERERRKLHLTPGKAQKNTIL